MLVPILLATVDSQAAPAAGSPQGVDDSFIVDVNSLSTLDIVSNDIENGSVAPIRIGAVSGIVAASPCMTCGSWTGYDLNNVFFQSNGVVGDAITV